MNTSIKNISFLSKTLLKYSVFQKTSCHFHFFTQFQFHYEELWESTYKRPYSRSHTSFKAYRIHCNYSKRRVVHEYLLGVEKRGTKCYCLLGVEKSCIDLTKGVLSSSVKLILNCIKIRIRKISSTLLGYWT